MKKANKLTIIMPEISYDTPLRDINEDLFRRESLVEMIVNSIKDVTKDNHPCVVYGIYGKWGEGKTTLMNFVEDKLIKQGKKDNISIVHFNPWMVNNEEALIREFFNCVTDDIDEQVKGFFKKYGSLVTFAARTFANVIMPRSGDRVVDMVNGINDSFVNSETTLSKLKKETSDAIKRYGKHLMVIIDDVDRLDKDEIHAVLRLVRQVADFDNCVYMLAMDVDMASKAVCEYYGGKDISDGRRFIDKIVQVPITIPQVPRVDFDKIIEKELHEVLNEYSTPEEITQITEDISPLLDTIRDLIRYKNQLSFVLSGLKDEVNMHDLCVLEAIKMVGNEIYDKIYSHRKPLMREPDLASHILDKEKEEKAVVERYDKTLDDIVLELCPPKKEQVRELVDELFTNRSFNHQQEINQKLVCTSVYFNKYFSQIVPSNLIPDTDINSIYGEIDRLSAEQLKAWIDEKHEKYGLSEIERAMLYILERVDDNLKEAEVASKLSKALAISDITRDYPPNPYSEIGINMASFWAYNVVPRYFFNFEKSSGERIVTDNDILNDTFSFIFNNAEMNFCLSIVYCLKDQISLHRYLKPETVHVLTERFSKESFDVQFGRAKVFLVELFSLWKNTDEQSFNAYADSLFKEKSLSCQKVLSKLISESDYVKDGHTFFGLFKKQCPQIKKRIEEEESEVRGDYAVRVFLGNYEKFVKEA